MRWPVDHVCKFPPRSIGQMRRREQERAARADKLVRLCLNCRGRFKAETRFMFMCVACRRRTGAVI